MELSSDPLKTARGRFSCVQAGTQCFCRRPTISCIASSSCTSLSWRFYGTEFAITFPMRKLFSLPGLQGVWGDGSPSLSSYNRFLTWDSYCLWMWRLKWWPVSWCQAPFWCLMGRSAAKAKPPRRKSTFFTYYSVKYWVKEGTKNILPVKCFLGSHSKICFSSS